MIDITDAVLRLGLAMLLGGLIGIEREFRDKAAGFRTVMFICLGAALFTIVSIGFHPDSDPARITAQIVTGVGFLGAGAILRDRGRVIGLTTAAIIWLAAAIGMAAGAGQYVLSAAAAGLVLLVLWLFPVLEGWISNIREVRVYEVLCADNVRAHAQVEKLIAGCGMAVHGDRQSRRGGHVICSWQVQGTPASHRKLVDSLIASKAVEEFHF
jgi:putative Mg2+ transporter-C (MgtC) family protein